MSTLTGLYGGGGLLPKFDVVGATLVDYTDVRWTNVKDVANHTVNLPGFNKDGDYIAWQQQNTTTTANKIEYYNSSAVLQWTINETNFNASATNIKGLCKVGSTLYAVATQNTTTNYWFGSINSSGTLTVLGSGSGTTAFQDDGSWGYLCRPTGQTNFWFIDYFQNTIEINASTGAVVNSYTVCPTLGGLITPNLHAFGFSASNTVGEYLYSVGNSSFSTTSARLINHLAHGSLLKSPISYPILTTDVVCKLIDWDDGFIPVHVYTNTASNRLTNRTIFDKAKVETWGDELATTLSPLRSIPITAYTS